MPPKGQVKHDARKNRLRVPVGQNTEVCFGQAPLGAEFGAMEQRTSFFEIMAQTYNPVQMGER